MGHNLLQLEYVMNKITDLKTTLRYLGVPIRERSYMFGDNGLVVDST